MNDKVAPAVLHIVVVGFHHKKGCQVEYAYPPLFCDESYNCTCVPEEWKFLPSLALPDGAHNFDEDTIYFHLPPRSHYEKQTTVFGVSCYRQIPSNLLKRKDADVTRGTVQKSVVVLSQKPLYGILHAKLQMITQVYFEEKDFSKIEILKQLYEHVNLSVTNTDESQQLVGLSVRSLVLKFHHQIVMLFKLILLERRILFYASPVKHLSGGILSLLSLYPCMIDQGLLFCTSAFQSYVEKMQISSVPLSNLDAVIETNSSENQTHTNNDFSLNSASHVGVNECSSTVCSEQPINISPAITSTLGKNDDIKPDIYAENDLHSYEPHTTSDEDMKGNVTTDLWSSTSHKALAVASTLTSGLESITSAFSSAFYAQENLEPHEWLAVNDIEDDEDENSLVSDFGNSRLEIQSDSPVRSESNLQNFGDQGNKSNSSIKKTSSSIKVLAELKDYESPFGTDKYGFPLSIFTKGYLCLPYVALQQHDDLMSNLERGYVVGATNMLYLTHRHMADVVIDLDSASMDIRDDSLRQVLHLSAADLRFAEHLVSHVSSEGHDDIYLHSTNWEGGDEWIQAQFSEYLVCMLSIANESNPDPKEAHDFNEHFLAAWKQTTNYKVWKKGDHQAITLTKTHHPFQAQYTLSDMRLRLHHNLQSTDHGRKIGTAMNSANSVVSNTGKIVGSAFVSAKSSVSSWWSSKMKKES